MSDIFDPVLCSASGHPGIDRWDSLINKIAPQYGVPPNLCKAHILYESGGDPNVVGKIPPPGYGLLQITSGVVDGKYNGENILDPYTNIKVGCRDFIAPLIRAFPTNLAAVIAGFNAGPGAEDTAIADGLSPATTTYGAWYVPAVQNAFSFLNATSHASLA